MQFSANAFHSLRAVVQAYDGEICLADLEPIYRQFPTPQAIRSLFYTSLSDGQRILIHDRRPLSDSTSWDIAHLLGHMFQWSMSKSQAKERGLQYSGAKARSMATKDFRGATHTVLLEVIRYELEANRFAKTVLLQLANEGPESDYAREVSEFIESDLKFVVDYYRGASHTIPQSSSRALDVALARIHEDVDAISLPAPSEFRFRRHEMLCVPVLHTKKPQDSGELGANSET